MAYTLDISAFCVGFVSTNHYADQEGSSYDLSKLRALQPNVGAAALVNQPLSYFRRSEAVPQTSALLNACPITSVVTFDRHCESLLGTSKLVIQSLAAQITSIIKKSAATETGTPAP